MQMEKVRYKYAVHKDKYAANKVNINKHFEKIIHDNFNSKPINVNV